MIHKWSGANGRSMAMSYDIFVPRHLFEHCSAYLRGVLQRLVPISAISRIATRGTSRDQERKRSRSKASVGSLACEDLARPKKVVVLRSWSIAIELEHQNSSRKPNSMNNRFCGVNMILNDFDIKILGSDSDTSWIRGYEFDMVWNMSLIYVFWHGFGCNIDVFLIWHRT